MPRFFMLKPENKQNLYQNLKARLKTDLIPTEIWQASGHDELLPAAVLVPLFWKNDELHILLTKRSESLKKHSGQVSFPGGRFDKEDLTIRQAAIRETREEIGIAEEYINVVGYLDDVQTASGFYVTPFVAVLDDNFSITRNTSEVSEVFSVPFQYFAEESNRSKHTAKYKGQNVNYYVYPHQKHTIWGVTAEIIVKLVDKIIE